MGDEVKIDKSLFHDRLSSFIAQWKNDKRSGDAIFNAAGSIVIITGKAEDEQVFQKNNAFQVQHVYCITRDLPAYGCGPVLAVRLRVPRHLDAPHYGSYLHCHDEEER